MRTRTPALRVLAVIALGGAVAAIGAGPASGAGTTAPKFSAAVKLGPYSGGEPSLAVDPLDGRHIYVTAPQGVPAAVGSLVGAPASVGVGFWASSDGGKSFPVKGAVGSGTGGGDSDVEVGLDHRVYVADLEASAAAICVSQDYGKTFSSGNALASQDKCNGVVSSNQQGPENDRQWLTRGVDGEIYLTYHDFSGGFPIIERSTDHGANFTPCGTILDPQGPAGKNYTPSGGTLVAKPVVDRNGKIFVEVTEPDVTAPPVGAKLNHLFIATADSCSGTTVFKNYSVYTNPDAELGKIFNAVAVDGGGTVYVVAGGKTKGGQSVNNIWLFVSHDSGKTWAAPVRVNTPNLKANVLPAIVGGLGKSQVAIGWYGTTTSGDPNTLNNQWKYYTATSFDGGKSFQQTTVTPNYIHYGDVCTQGVMCGLVPNAPGNRNLLDFSSFALDPKTGCLVIAFPGDPQNQGSHNDFTSYTYVARQVGGRCLSKSGGSATMVGTLTPSHDSTATAATKPATSAARPGASRTDAATPAGTAVATHNVANRTVARVSWLLALVFAAGLGVAGLRLRKSTHS